MTDSLFAGLKVIDCASWIAGPAAATILSDFGADVVKIEPPGAGDPWRASTPVPGKTTDYYWQLTSRNKRSLALDLKHADGLAVLYRLLASADVFVTNFPLPVRERLKIAASHVLALNPRLIYASLTAYGEEGEEAARTGFDSTAYWARTGLMDMVRATPDDGARALRAGHGRPPQRHRALRRHRDGALSAGEDRQGRHRPVLAAPERPVGECLLRPEPAVRGAGGTPRAARQRPQSARQPLSLPRRTLVHHGPVQRAAPAARLSGGDRLHASGRRRAVRHERGAQGERRRAGGDIGRGFRAARPAGVARDPARRRGDVRCGALRG